jgi:phosphoribosylformylglycinamidine synthase I
MVCPVGRGVRVKRIAVLVFAGTNSEDETLRLLRAYGGDAYLVHWSRQSTLKEYDAYVLAGGFAYEDRIRAGAIAARDAMMEPVIQGAARGKLVLGICNGAQIALEAGLVPGPSNGKPTAAFTRNAPGGHFVCTLVHVKLAVDPSRSPITASLPRDAVMPAWAAHAEGRLAARAQTLEQIAAGEHVAFVYAHADGRVDERATPNGSALHCAGLLNREGNVLAIMPHPERVFPQHSPLFESFVRAVAVS